MICRYIRMYRRVCPFVYGHICINRAGSADVDITASYGKMGKAERYSKQIVLSKIDTRLVSKMDS